MEHLKLKEAHEKIKKSKKPISNVNDVHKDSLTLLEKIAVKVTEKVGSVGFFLIIAIWTLVWLSWNALCPTPLVFDPFPAFVMWLFISNMIQIFLMPLIMIGQNLQGRHSEARAESDYQVDVQAEKEIEVIMLELQHQTEQIEEILKEVRK